MHQNRRTANRHVPFLFKSQKARFVQINLFFGRSKRIQPVFRHFARVLYAVSQFDNQREIRNISPRRKKLAKSSRRHFPHKQHNEFPKAFRKRNQPCENPHASGNVRYHIAFARFYLQSITVESRLRRNRRTVQVSHSGESCAAVSSRNRRNDKNSSAGKAYSAAKFFRLSESADSRIDS